MALPKVPFRKTAHAKPKYQLYQVGFNASNSCWLDGGWITVTKAEYDKRKGPLAKEYARVRKQMESQHHRDKGTPPAKMTRAQRTAYEFCSGSYTLEAMGTRDDGTTYGQPIGIGMAGNRPDATSIRWLQNHRYKLVRWVKTGPKGKPTNQLKGLVFPAEFVIENKKDDAFDHLTETVSQNRGRAADMFESAVATMKGEGAPLPAGEMMGMNFQQFVGMMAFHQLTEQEELIVRGEWHRSIGEDDDAIPFEPEKERLLYVEMRAKLKAAVGEKFDEVYANAQAEHNECERANLDNSNGTLYCYVLPKFNDDGTHEPWGPRDVPWGHKPRKPRKAKTEVSVNGVSP